MSVAGSAVMSVAFITRGSRKRGGKSAALLRGNVTILPDDLPSEWSKDMS